MLVRPYQLLLLLLLTYTSVQAAPGHTYKYRHFGPGAWSIYSPAGAQIRQALITCTKVIIDQIAKFGADASYTYETTALDLENNKQYEVHLTYNPITSVSTFDINDFKETSYVLQAGSTGKSEYMTQGLASIVSKVNECYLGQVFYDVYEYKYMESKKRSEVWLRSVIVYGL